ncbi:MAG: carboxypeptidase regulatory-like domain-containing protein, partial [Candidatus Zixiibacteriota bacterium]
FEPIESVYVDVFSTPIHDISDTGGYYVVGYLISGEYDLLFSHNNFHDTILSDIPVTPGDSTILNIVMKVACNYIVGDINNSGGYNGLDITFGVNYFKGGQPPTFECYCPPHGTWFVAGDVNGSCIFNGLDITYGVNFFKGGRDPVACADCPPVPAVTGRNARNQEFISSKRPAGALREATK